MARLLLADRVKARDDTFLAPLMPALNQHHDVRFICAGPGPLLAEAIDWADIGLATLETLTMVGGSLVFTVLFGLPLPNSLGFNGAGVLCQLALVPNALARVNPDLRELLVTMREVLLVVAP